MSEKCNSLVGRFLGHKWKEMSQIVPAAIPDTRTYLGQNGQLSR